MSEAYQYTTVEQQIQKLKSQKLLFQDENMARQILKTYGYYNIINGYRDPYIIRDYDGKKYSSDVTFEQIFALFALDHNIRDAVLLSMIDFEEHLKAVVADIIAEDFGSDYHQYLQRNNYRDRYVSNPRYSRNSILDGMIHTAERSYTQPIRYYREVHGIIPPWILFKGTNFGTLVNFIKFFKPAQRDKLVDALYSDAIADFNAELVTFKQLLSDTLATCLEYRNLSAHGGRIYNYIPNSNIRLLETSNIKKGLPQLLQILEFLNYKQPFSTLDAALSSSLNDYCQSYPNDLDRLEKAIGFEIYSETRVWINERTHIYHSIQHCSGSQNCIRLEINRAKELGYNPCKKCCQNL